LSADNFLNNGKVETLAGDSATKDVVVVGVNSIRDEFEERSVWNGVINLNNW